nr:ribonuclease H-like domain-containing protein [Tanacetum cinerariifolium]
NETVHTTFNVELSYIKPDEDFSHSNRPSAPIIEDWVSDLEDESEAEPTQNAPSFVQPAEHVKTPRPFVKPVEHSIPANNPWKDNPKSRGHSNRRNKKTCFVCKSLTHLIKDCDYYGKQMVQKPARNYAHRGNNQHYARMIHPNPQRHVVPTAVLTRSKLAPLTAARPVTTAVPYNNVTRPRPAKTIFTKPHSPPRRHINHRPSPKPSTFPPKVTTVKAHKVNVVMGVQGNWIQVSYGLGPKETLNFLFLVMGNPQLALKDKGVIDSGCLRHMTWNMSYLSEFESINEGYVAFGRNPRGGKITSKGKIRIDTECFVLSSDFKLPDENHVLLRVPRENNMYNVDLKNIVPSGDLTCLFAKATLDES